MEISFLDLQKINKPYLSALKEAASNVLNSGCYILNQQVNEFEKEFSAYCDVSYCVGIGNGYDALLIIFMALEFEEGSEVICPSNTYIASVLPLFHLGLKIVWVEPDEFTYTINVDLVEKAITDKTVAILSVDLYGRCCEYDKLKNLSQKYHLKLIADCAQSHGALYKGSKAGSFADASAFSFYPTKNLGAIGDGGAILTNDKPLSEKCKALRNYGSSIKNKNKYWGVNSRLDEIQASCLRVKLRDLDNCLTRRREFAHMYLSEIKNIDVQLPTSDQIYDDSWHLFVVRHHNRDDFRNYLNNRGIQTDVHYPIPVYQQECYLESQKLKLLLTERLCSEIVSIPLNPSITKEESQYIVKAINKF